MPDTRILVPAQELAAKNVAHFPNESAEYRAARNALLVEEIELRRALERLLRDEYAVEHTTLQVDHVADELLSIEPATQRRLPPSRPIQPSD